MRLKEDSSSWKSSGIKKRDYRHDHSQPEWDMTHKKKNTKKWCRGKVGQPHQLDLVDSTNFLGFSWDTYRCVACGKKIYKDTKKSKGHQSPQPESHNVD